MARHDQPLGASTPSRVIARLPTVAQAGRLPLHLAAMNNAPADVVEQLLEVYEGAAQQKDEVSRRHGTISH